jgi:hypothetical protein
MERILAHRDHISRKRQELFRIGSSPETARRTPTSLVTFRRDKSSTVLSLVLNAARKYHRQSRVIRAISEEERAGERRWSNSAIARREEVDSRIDKIHNRWMARDPLQ